jgi:hypothetical protein
MTLGLRRWTRARARKASRRNMTTHSDEKSSRRADADAADEWLTTGETARALKVDPRTIGRMVAHGRLAPPARINGSKMFSRSEVQRVVVERRTVTQSPAEHDQPESYDATTAATVLRAIAGGRSAESLVAEGVHPRTILAILRDHEALQQTSAAEHPGTAALFAAFDGGETPADAVKRTGLSPRIVGPLYQEWAQLRGGLWLREQELREIAIAFGLGEGGLNDSRMFVLAVKNRLDVAEGRCGNCNEATATMCETCARSQSLSDANDRAHQAQTQLSPLRGLVEWPPFGRS